MATTKSSESDLDLREELDALRKQVADLLAELQSKGKEKSSQLADKLENELGDYQDKAEQKLKDAYAASTAGLDTVGDQIRRNPVASLLVAFGVGYVLSRLTSSDK